MQHQVPAVEVGAKHEGIELKDPETVPVQLQVFRHLGVQGVEHERTTGEVETGEEFLGDAGPANQRAPLQDLNLQAGPRQVTAGDEPIVTPSDNENVEFVRFPGVRFHLRSFVPVPVSGGTFSMGPQTPGPHSEAV